VSGPGLWNDSPKLEFLLFVRGYLGSGGMQDQSQLIKSEYYRRLARECLEIARTMQTDGSRFALVEMAKSWFRLAEKAREIEER